MHDAAAEPSADERADANREKREAHVGTVCCPGGASREMYS